MSKNDVTNSRAMQRKEQLQMLLHPERYTDEQLDEMLNETDIPVPDIDTEWRKFLDKPSGRAERKANNYPLSTVHYPLLKLAAAFIGLLMLSGIAYAAVQIVQHTQEQAWNQGDRSLDSDGKALDQGPVPLIPEVAPTKEAPVIYNNVELEQIMQNIADGYGVKVEFRNEAARTLRFYLQWEADDTLQEIIDKINHFEKVHLTLTDETITIN